MIRCKASALRKTFKDLLKEQSLMTTLINYRKVWLNTKNKEMRGGSACTHPLLLFTFCAVSKHFFWKLVESISLLYAQFTRTHTNASPVTQCNAAVWSSVLSLSPVFLFSFIYSSPPPAHRQSRAIHYARLCFNLVGKFNFQMNSVLF